MESSRDTATIIHLPGPELWSSMQRFDNFIMRIRQVANVHIS